MTGQAETFWLTYRNQKLGHLTYDKASKMLRTLVSNDAAEA